MSTTLQQVQRLVAHGDIRVSLHGYDELASDGISVREAIKGLAKAIVIETYPAYPKGPCVLVLERDRENRPIHVVWGIPAGQKSPAVLVTAYRPDPARWEETWQKRRT